jgi:hypothetical protein
VKGAPSEGSDQLYVEMNAYWAVWAAHVAAGRVLYALHAARLCAQYVVAHNVRGLGVK